MLSEDEVKDRREKGGGSYGGLDVAREAFVCRVEMVVRHACVCAGEDGPVPPVPAIDSSMQRVLPCPRTYVRFSGTTTWLLTETRVPSWSLVGMWYTFGASGCGSLVIGIENVPVTGAFH